MCTLHSAATQRGISLLVPHVTAKLFVLSVPVTDLYNDEKAQNVCWLEAGGIGLGPIIVDAALALPTPELLRAQREFIALHDQHTRRLSFLWGDSSECGCLGGSVFFGSNRNGASIFQPSEGDFRNSINSAVLHICNDGVNFGFGESILRPGQPVFEIDLPVVAGMKTAVSAAEEFQRPADDDVASRTLTKESATLAVSSWISEQHGPSLGERHEDSSEASTMAKLASGVEQDTTPSSMPTPSELKKWPESQLAGSLYSLSDTAASGLQRRAHGHGRTYSYEPPKTFAAAANADRMPSASGTPDTTSTGALARAEFGRSRGSLRSSSGSHSHSRRSSLTSPVLRRLSSQLSVQQEDAGGSLVSVISSEQFYTASEYAPSGLPMIPSRTDMVSPASDEVTGSSVYDMAVEFFGSVDDTGESSTDVESFVSAPEDAGVAGDETLRPPRISSDEEDDDGATFAADEDIGEESFDTDATQVCICVAFSLIGFALL